MAADVGRERGCAPGPTLLTTSSGVVGLLMGVLCRWLFAHGVRTAQPPF